MHKVKVDAERCKGCLLCTTMCVKGILRKGGEMNAVGFYTVVVTDEKECTGCALCAMACPDVAIEVWK